MDKFAEMKRNSSRRTPINEEKYLAAKDAMPEDIFHIAYLREMEDGIEKFYQLTFDPDYAHLLLLEEIRRNTENTSRYVKYIWYFMVAMLVLGGFYFLFSSM